MRGEIHETVRVGIRERAKQQRVDGGEDGGGGTDAETECDDGGEGEGAVAPELAEGVTGVLPEEFETGAGAVIADGLFDLFDAAEIRERGAARLLRGHAGGNLLIGEHVCICANFVLKLIFDLLLAKKIACEILQTRPERHHGPPTLPSVRSTWRIRFSATARFPGRAGVRQIW